MRVSTVYVTAPTAEVARELAKKIVNERLAACANIIPEITSIYRWEGQMQAGHEAILLLKTRTDLVSELTTRLQALHEYDCPCVIAWEASGGNAAFFEWIYSETKSHRSSD